MTAELECSLILEMDNDELAALQYLVKNVSSAIWVTNAGLLDGTYPKKSLASGLAKTLMTEQPSFRLSCFDIEPQGTNLTRSAALILDQELHLRDDTDSDIEMNLVEKDGLVYISRFAADDIENAELERRINPPVEKGDFLPGMELDFEQVGHIDSFYYKHKEDSEARLALQPDQVLLESQVYCLSAIVSGLTLFWLLSGLYLCRKPRFLKDSKKPNSLVTNVLPPFVRLDLRLPVSNMVTVYCLLSLASSIARALLRKVRATNYYLMRNLKISLEYLCRPVLHCMQ